MFRFERHPATITLSDGLGMAARYLLDTWEWWVIPVVGLAIATGLLSAAAGSTASGVVFDQGFRALPRSQQLNDVMGMLMPVFGVSIVLLIAGLVVGWYYTALAVHGLRGRPITADWVVGAGLRSLLGSLLVGAAWIAVWIAFALLAVATLGFGLLLLVVVVPVAIYVAIRLYFWNLAIFDGAGVVESFRVAWYLSDGGAMRMLGWGVTFAVLSIIVSIGAGIIRLPFFAVPAIGSFVSALLTGAFGVYTLYGAAVLYESQRWTKLTPGYGQPGYGYGYPMGMPPTGYPPQGGYPAQGGYPTPGGYPQQAGYPQQGGYVQQPAGPPPAPSAAGQPPASSPPGTPPPLVPWAPVPQQPTWNPTPPPGWAPAPGSGWAPAPPMTAPPATGPQPAPGQGWTPGPPSSAPPGTPAASLPAGSGTAAAQSAPGTPAPQQPPAQPGAATTERPTGEPPTEPYNPPPG